MHSRCGKTEPVGKDWVNPDAGAQRVVDALEWGEKITLYNLLELVFVGAIMLRLASAFPYRSVDSAWFASFYLVAQLGLPQTSGFWLNAATVAVEGASLLLLLGGFALLIGLAAEKMRPGPWQHDWVDGVPDGSATRGVSHVSQ